MSGSFIGIVGALVLVGLYTILVYIFSAGSRKKRAEFLAEARRGWAEQKMLFTESQRTNEILIGEVRRSNEYLSRIVTAIEKKDSIH